MCQERGQCTLRSTHACTACKTNPDCKKANRDRIYLLERMIPDAKLFTDLITRSFPRRLACEWESADEHVEVGRMHAFRFRPLVHVDLPAQVASLGLRDQRAIRETRGMMKLAARSFKDGACDRDTVCRCATCPWALCTSTPMAS